LGLKLCGPKLWNCGVNITSTFSLVLPLTTGRSQIEARSAQESGWMEIGSGMNMM